MTTENVFYDCAVLDACGHDRMTEAEWLISVTLSLCNKRRELDRSEMLSLRKKGKRGFTSKEQQIEARC